MQFFFKKSLKILIVILITILIDQSSKISVMEYVNHDNSNMLKVTSYLNFVYVWNYGISFGFFSEYNLNYKIFVFISVLLLAFILFFLRKENAMILGMIVGGGIGNVIDRILRGAVFDFIDFHIAGWHYPAFNVADSCVVLGLGLIIIKEMYSKKNIESNE
ncbi:MAG: signal peptidase II [Candidatus Midichloriaceae bacterium]|jgi:signal peptidase II